MHNGLDRRRRVKGQGPATNQTPEIGASRRAAAKIAVCGVAALDRIP